MRLTELLHRYYIELEELLELFLLLKTILPEKYTKSIMSVALSCWQNNCTCCNNYSKSS